MPLTTPDVRPRYSDRLAAGRVLAERLREFRGRPDVVVVGLPRGGAPVAHEVARALEAPFDVLPVRKVAIPGHPAYVVGAVGPIAVSGSRCRSKGAWSFWSTTALPPA